MPDLTPGAARALPYWGIIERAANETLGTAGLWDAIRAAAEDAGLESPGVSATDVAQLYSYAAGIQHRSDRFERADPDERLDGRYISSAPWSRGAGERDALGMWQVRYEHTVIGPDGPETSWRTSTFSGAIPDTKEGLLAAIAEDTEHLAKKYDVSHVGFSTIQILEV